MNWGNYINGECMSSKTCAEQGRSIGGGFAPAPWLPSSAPLDFLEGCHNELGARLLEKIHRNLACADYHHHWKIQPALEPAHNEDDEPETLQYFYHSDHLGSASFITDATGYVDQHIQYLPFGELFVSQRNTSFDSRYKFTAKELDNETNYTYFGARYYDSDISIWLSVDPLADERSWLSPYNYCQWNPVGRVDPTGALDDDYFNKMGKYLGSDEAKTDNVKIIDQKDWDANKTINPDGSESITHTIGVTISADHSKSNLTEDATLNVYNYYNSTGLDLKAKQNETGAAGLTFVTRRKNGKTSEWIEVKIEGNKRTKICDHANEIINSFIHEGQHYSDYKTLGFDGYVNLPINQSERRAVSTQMKHESFEGTRPAFQQAVKRYGEKYEMIFPMKPKPVILIPFNK